MVVDVKTLCTNHSQHITRELQVSVNCYKRLEINLITRQNYICFAMEINVYKFGSKRGTDSFALLFLTDITFNSNIVINSETFVIHVF